MFDVAGSRDFATMRKLSLVSPQFIRVLALLMKHQLLVVKLSHGGEILTQRHFIFLWTTLHTVGKILAAENGILHSVRSKNQN